MVQMRVGRAEEQRVQDAPGSEWGEQWEDCERSGDYRQRVRGQKQRISPSMDPTLCIWIRGLCYGGNSTQGALDLDLQRGKNERSGMSNGLDAEGAGIFNIFQQGHWICCFIQPRKLPCRRLP